MAGTTVGEAFVKIRPDTTGFESDAKKSIGGVLAGVATGFAAVKVVDFFKSSMSAASDFNESASKAEQIFGKNSDAIRKWAAGAVGDFGQTSQQALESAASFGNMFQQLDIGSGQATRMSKTMVELASDFASFHNADITEVLQAQQAAFRGEYDAVQRFVPTLNAAAVEQKALAMTGKESTKELTAGEKAAATYALMMQGAGKAIGDFDRTSGGAANQMRQFQAGMFELKATVGAALLPALTGVLKVLRPMVEWLSEHKTVAAALALVVGGVLTAAFIAWTVAMVKSTAATLGLSGGVSGLGASIGRTLVVMSPWLAALALAAGLYLGLKRAMSSGPQISASAAEFMKMTSVQMKNALAVQYALGGWDGLKKKLVEVAATSVSTARKMVEAADLPRAKRQELIRAIDEEERAQRRAQKASEDDARAKGDQAKKINDVQTAMQDLNNYIRLQIDDTAKVEDATLNLDEALADYATTLQGTTADTLEGRRATLDTERAIRDFGQAVYDSTYLATASWDTASRAQVYALAQVANGLAPDSPLRIYLDQLIDKLKNGIPTVIPITFQIGSTGGYEGYTGEGVPAVETFATGGFVRRRPGGILANIGEGREDEYILPTSKLSEMLNAAAINGAGSGAGDTFNIYTVASDPVPFALEVSRKKRREMYLAGR